MILAGPFVFLASLATAIWVGLIVTSFNSPPRRLASRVRPYARPTLHDLDRSSSDSPVTAVFGPMIRDLANLVGRVVEVPGSAVSIERIRQAGWHKGREEPEMLGAYRLTQLRVIGLALSLALIVGQLIGGTFLQRSLLMSLAVVIGSTRTRGRLEAAIEKRRETMKIEIYTVNQLLAMRVRAGGGVVQAVSGLCGRGRGEVIGELDDALRLHRSGWSAADAFRRIAELTPEPFCSRTYRLLASAEERGADLAGALLALSEDVRETRRESIRRSATKRRAGMLVPTIALLAPVLILFVAAPLPYLVTSWQ